MHRRIHRSWKTRAAAVAVTALALATPVAGQRRDLQKPLVLASQGSFFVGGETKSLGTGGDIEVMHLPKMGIKGNSHMLMQDRNNLDLADLILQWIDRHAEPYAKGATRTN